MLIYDSKMQMQISYDWTNKIFMWTSLSRSNEAGVNVRPPICPYVRMYVNLFIRLQKVFPISTKFGMLVKVDECCTTVYHVYLIQVKVMVTEVESCPFQSLSPPPICMQAKD